MSNTENTTITNSMNRAIVKSYGFMILGLIITAMTSFLVCLSPTFLVLSFSSIWFSLLLFIAQIAIVIAMGRALQKPDTSSLTMKVLFVIFAITMGISMSSLLVAYTASVLGISLLISIIFFACLTVIGATTKKDLTKLGTICLAALLALIIGEIILLIFNIEGMTNIIAIIGLLIFAGLTAWDTQRLHKILKLEDGSEVEKEKIGIYFALELYLDFINIFLYILRLIGNNNN